MCDQQQWMPCWWGLRQMLATKDGWRGSTWIAFIFSKKTFALANLWTHDAIAHSVSSWMGQRKKKPDCRCKPPTAHVDNSQHSVRESKLAQGSTTVEMECESNLKTCVSVVCNYSFPEIFERKWDLTAGQVLVVCNYVSSTHACRRTLVTFLMIIAINLLTSVS